MKQTALQNSTDTIVAIATAPGRGGVGVVRLSGGDLTPFIQTMLSVGDSLKPRVATFSRVLDSQQETIDEAVVLLFPSPKSFTGETVLEIQAHGGPVILDTLVQRCIELGARIARPGEFSERAFLNDKMDLAQAEAIPDPHEVDAAMHEMLRQKPGGFEHGLHRFNANHLSHLIRIKTQICPGSSANL